MCDVFFVGVFCGNFTSNLITCRKTMNLQAADPHSFVSFFVYLSSTTSLCIYHPPPFTSLCIYHPPPFCVSIIHHLFVYRPSPTLNLPHGWRVNVKSNVKINTTNDNYAISEGVDRYFSFGVSGPVGYLRNLKDLYIRSRF